MTRTRLIRGIAALLLGAVLLSGAAALAAPGRSAEQTEPVRILFRVPAEGGEISLSDSTQQWVFPHDGEYAVLEAPPGNYTLRCGELCAALRMDTQPEVLGGAAAFDGEVLTMGHFGTLELVCSVRPGQQMHIRIQAQDGLHTRAAAYDPEQPGTVVHRMTLPAGSVSVTANGHSQNLTLRPGETMTINLG